MPSWPPSTRGEVRCDVAAPLLNQDVPQEALHHFGFDVARWIVMKGYCVMDLGLDEKNLQQALTACAVIDEADQFSAPPGEVVDGLLGEEGSTRTAGYDENIRQLLDSDTEGEANPLDMLDWQLDRISDALSLASAEAFGFELTKRTDLIIHESGTPREAFPYITQNAAMQYYRTFASHRIMCLVFLGPECGTLEMQPFDDDSNFHELDVEPGMGVILRADLLSHGFRAPEESFTLSCWLLQTPSPSQHQVIPSGVPLTPVAQELRKILEGPLEEGLHMDRVDRRLLHHWHRTGGQTAVRGVASRLPGMVEWLPCLANGPDVAVTIPLYRWNHDLYYGEDPENVSKICCRHGGFLEAAWMFDNKAFKISPIEAETLAPEQRHTLEVGYEVMLDAGFQRKTMEKTATGVYVGATWNEWNYIRPMESPLLQKFGSTSNMNAITANRLSFLYGFNGASLSLDTESASSLMAVCKGNDDVSMAVQRRTTGQSLCLGVSMLLSHKVLLEHASKHYLSKRGRCLSFDATADGYVIGEACGGLLMAPLAEVLEVQAYDHPAHPVRGLISATRMGNMGRSGLKSPDPRDQRLLRTAIEVAGLSPLDIDSMECHSAGLQLVDAAEVCSLAKVMRSINRELKEQREPFMLGALKANLTHSRAASGAVALLKALAMQGLGCQMPSQHLSHINPHMEEETKLRMLLASEPTPFWTKSAYVGVTAMGLGGALAHVVAWGKWEENAQEKHLPRWRMDICYWPGGGGELGDDAHPDRAYTIVGSWSAWQKNEVMTEEEDGIWGYTVTLGEHLIEHFLICLDGDPKRTLHPPIPQAPINALVEGPERAVGNVCWCIDGRPREEEEQPEGTEYDGTMWEGAGSRIEDDPDKALAANGFPTDGHVDQDNLGGDVSGAELRRYGGTQDQPGDQYRVRLSVRGKWRNVEWEKIERDPPKPLASLVFTARYWVVGDWNRWGLIEEEMQPHPSINGLFSLDVLISRHDWGSFQILVNKDTRQVLFPSPGGVLGSLACPPRGPEMFSNVRGVFWIAEGKPGDVFRIELQISVENGAICKAVAFRRVGRKQLTPEQIREAKEDHYFLVGSWNHFVGSQEMMPNRDGSCYESEVTVGPNGCECFQILLNNDWRLVHHPHCVGCGPSELLGPNDSSVCDGVEWMIGGPDEVAAQPGSRYTVRLHLVDGAPVRVDWVLHN